MSSTADDTDKSTSRGLLINAEWLVRLRWVAAAGQLSTIFAVIYFWDVQLRLTPILVAIAITAVTNIFLSGWVLHLRDQQTAAASKTAVQRVLGSVMLLDLVVLTSLLYFTGGTSNPFCIFYLVNLALAGVLLPPHWAWLLNGFAIVAMLGLYFRHVPVEVLQPSDRLLRSAETVNFSPAALGVIVAFATCSSVIVYFATRLTTELEHSQVARRRAEVLRARSEKLEALGTLAAGAAHELATPLSTIAVVAQELQHALDGQAVAAGVEEDLQLIGSQLKRCRKILDRMSLQAADVGGEPVVTITAEALIDQVLSELPAQDQVDVSFGRRCRAAKVAVPLVGLAQALRGLIQNALDASSQACPRIEVAERSGVLDITVVDRGPGMSTETLARAGEPFFTTKDPGQGMGLGLFLARSVVERIGGTLEIESELTVGTTVTVRLPLGESSQHHGSRPAVAVS